MITDSANFTTKKITQEGYLKGQAIVTCEGVQQYAGHQLQQSVSEPLIPNKIYNVFRPSSSFLNDATIESLKLKPVTYDHPEEGQAVTATNYSDKSVGVLGESVKNLNDKQLMVNFLITDPKMVDFVKDNNLQVSLGYDADIVPKKGEYEGQPYDFSFKNPMIINHLAISPPEIGGRCGDKAFILDNNFTTKRGETMNNGSDDMTKTMGDIADKLSQMVQNVVQNALQNALQKALNDAPKVAQQVTTNDEDMMMPPTDDSTMSDTQVAQNADKMSTMQSDANVVKQSDGYNTLKDGADMQYAPTLTTSPDPADQVVVATESPDDLDDVLDMLDTARTISPNVQVNTKDPIGTLKNALKTNGYQDNALAGKSKDYLLGVAQHIKAQRQKARMTKPKIQDNSVNFNPYPMATGAINNSDDVEEINLAQLRSERASQLAQRRFENRQL